MGTKLSTAGQSMMGGDGSSSPPIETAEAALGRRSTPPSSGVFANRSLSHSNGDVDMDADSNSSRGMMISHLLLRLCILRWKSSFSGLLQRAYPSHRSFQTSWASAYSEAIQLDPVRSAKTIRILKLSTLVEPRSPSRSQGIHFLPRQAD